MPKIIYFYIFKEISLPSVIGIGVLSSVFLVGRLFQTIEKILDQGIPFLFALELFLSLIPALMVFVVPISFFLGVLVALGRLSADNEIIALKASGIGLYRLSYPVMFFSLLTFLLTSFLMFYGVPWGSKNFRETLFKLAETKANVDIKEQVFNDTFGDLVIYVNNISQKGTFLEGVMIYDERDPEVNNTIFARQGYLISDPQAKKVILQLFNGSIHVNEAKKETYRIINFNTYQLNISLTEELEKAQKKRGIKMKDREMSIKELRNKIKTLKGEGENAGPELTELHFKFAIPFAALIFGLIGIPLGAQRTRSGRSWGFVLCIFMLLLYYILYCVGKNLETSGVISPVLAAWLPNLIFTILGIYLLTKEARESPPWIMVWGDKGMKFLRERWRRFSREV
jgi:lipopolysaccharide export system permease protein